MTEDTKYWVALSTHQKIGARTLMKLYKRFKNLEKVWHTRDSELSAAGLDSGQITAVRDIINKKDPEKEIKKLEKYQITVTIYPDENYPIMLKELPDPPGLLYIRGQLQIEDEAAIAIVGSRKYTRYGEAVTYRLVYPLAQEGITIVSGLALGIDTLAHRATLEAKGRTIGVLACGLDQIYPVSNVRLSDKILATGGAIISEFPLGMPALRFNFPIRNRIIAGLSLGTVVVEGAENSGSLLTAAAAIEYNREVFAVPGPIFSETSQGTNRLIKMGAKLVTSAEDILEELDIPQKVSQAQAREIIGDTKEEKILLNLLREPQLIDVLVIKSGLDSSKVNSTIIQMEIKGKIINLGGTRYTIRNNQ